jgi:hypothetical protein
MPDSDPCLFNFAPTGIGSVPFTDVETTCREIAGILPLIPFWPQFVKRSNLENMLLQYTEGLPFLTADEGRGSVTVSADSDRESQLISFYESYLSDDLNAFAISRDFAPGLYLMIDLVKSGECGNGKFIKGQTVGPFTFAAGVVAQGGKAALHDREIFDALTSGLCAKALWQVRLLASCGRQPIIFLDEPYLAGFGSAFCTVQAEQVTDVMERMIRYLKERADVLIGIHCCGNTDWAMLLDAGFDIINFDAFGYLDYFLLYRDKIAQFLKRGGVIAWGIVPTSEFRGGERPETLISKLSSGLERLCDAGFDAETLKKQSLITPACGMGSMEPLKAKEALLLLSAVSTSLGR